MINNQNLSNARNATVLIMKDFADQANHIMGPDLDPGSMLEYLTLASNTFETVLHEILREHAQSTEV